MLGKLEAYTKLMRLHRPWPILLILFSTYWGLFLGPNHPTILEFVIFTAGVILTRSAGCVINDYFDRKIDGKVKRTKLRPLQLFVVKPREAVGLFVLLMLVAGCLLFFLQPMVMLMGVAAFFLTLLYPLAKRFTYFPQVVLGVTFNFGLLMADLQVNNQISTVALAYYAFAVLWTVHYDTLYALCDYTDDLKIGVKSIPTFFKGKIYAFLVWTAIFLVLLLMLAFNLAGFSIVKNMVLFIFAGFLAYQYRQLALYGNEIGLKLFTQHVWMGFLILLGVMY